MKEQDQISMFDLEEMSKWKEHWRDMPEFSHEDLTPEKSIIVHFACQEDRDAFAKLVGQTITYKTQSLWYPKAEIDRMVTKLYVDES